MSWKTATAIADKLYADLRAEHDAGFVRMVIRALTRRLNRDENENNPPPISHLPSSNSDAPGAFHRRDPGGPPEA